MPHVAIEITLLYSDPTISRTVLVPDGMSLSGLHAIIQQAFGWENLHTHQFVHDKNPYRAKVAYTSSDSVRFNRDFAPGSGPRDFPEEDVTVLDFFPSVSRARTAGWSARDALYHYDWGDDWFHKLRRVKVPADAPELPEDGVALLATTGGWALEDIGGMSGRDGFADEFHARKRGEHSGRPAIDQSTYEDWFCGYSDAELHEIFVEAPFAKVANAVIGTPARPHRAGAPTALVPGTDTEPFELEGPLHPGLIDIVFSVLPAKDGPIARALDKVDLPSIPKPDHDDAVRLTAGIRSFIAALDDTDPGDARLRQTLLQLQLVREREGALEPVKSKAGVLNDPVKLLDYLSANLFDAIDPYFDMSRPGCLWAVDRLLTDGQRGSLEWDIREIISDSLTDEHGEPAVADDVFADLAPILTLIDSMGVLESADPATGPDPAGDRAAEHSLARRQPTEPGRRFLAEVLRG